MLEQLVTDAFPRTTILFGYTLQQREICCNLFVILGLSRTSYGDSLSDQAGLCNVEYRSVVASYAHSRDDLILYTVTTDATLRVFLPVLDTPHYLQLHASLDVFSDAADRMDRKDNDSNIFWLHKDTLANSFRAILSANPGNADETSFRRLKEMNTEGWDFFVRVFPDNSLVVRAVAVSNLTTRFKVRF